MGTSGARSESEGVTLRSVRRVPAAWWARNLLGGDSQETDGAQAPALSRADPVRGPPRTPPDIHAWKPQLPV